MAYTINKTDGTILTTISDGTLDTTTNLSFFGKNYAGYGEALNENQVKLLENFANTTANAPDKPIKGQLFYDTTLNQMQVYNGSAFKAVSGAIISTTEPTSGAQGDLWYDSTNEQLYVYTGSSWVLVGPAATAGSGVSGGIVQVITDDTGVDRTVIQLMTSDTIVAMVSSVEFTPQSAVSGFSIIKKGLTLSTAISSNRYNGTATDSDALGGVAASNYISTSGGTISGGSLRIYDSGLTIGADSDMSFVQSGANHVMSNVTDDGNIVLRVSPGGVTESALTVNGTDASVTIANNLTVSGNLIVNGSTTEVNTTNMTVEDPLIVLNRNSASVGDRDIGIIFDRGINTSTALIWDESADEFAFINTTSGDSTAGAVTISSYADIRFNEATGTTSGAYYADLAERYESDTPLESGDVVKIGGEKEITKTSTAYDTDVFGVISTDPAFKMNISAGDDTTHPYVALSGRVPCKVKGQVSKGDRLTTSDQPGVAQKADLDNELCSVYAIIGRALEDKKSDDTASIEIAVGKV